MIVQFNVRDFLDRAEAAYPERIGTDRRARAAGPAVGTAHLRRAGRAGPGPGGRPRPARRGPGERVAIVSHNSSRLLTSFFGVCGWGRILVPINFRLAPAEVEYIVGHSGASVLLVDPELADDLSGIEVPHRFVLGAESDDVLFPADGDPELWRLGRGGHRHHQLHLGHHRPAQGRAAHPPQLLGERRRLRMAHPTLRPGRLPPHPAHVPRQRLGHAVVDHGDGLHPGGAAQGGRHRDPPAGGAPRGQPAVRGTGRGQRGARRRARVGPARSRGGIAPASWWPARHRPAGPSSGSSPSSAGSSSRSTA